MDKVCFCQIRDMFQAINKVEIQLQEQLGLKINEAMVLFQLSEKDGMFSGRIAGALGLSKSNASKVIVAMEKKGYLRRQPCKKDTRCQRFFLEPEGKKMLKKWQALQLDCLEKTVDKEQSETEDNNTNNKIL